MLLFSNVGDLDEFITIKSKPIAYEKKDVIYQEGPPFIFFIHTGWVRTFLPHERQASGIHTGLYGPNEFFGALHQPVAKLEAAQCLTPVEMSLWNGGDFNQMLIESGGYAALAKLAVQREARLRARVAEEFRLGMQFSQRVALALLDLGRMGRNMPNGRIRIDPAPTHGLLGSMAMTSRELASKEISRLEKGGMLWHHRRQWMDIDPIQLRHFALTRKLRRAPKSSQKAA